MIEFERNLALEFVRVTEAAAIAASQWIGKKNKIAADKAAVDAMRKRFKFVDFNGEIVIGEGKKDKAPELYVGEKVGSGYGIELDIAVDPLEATASVANGMPNAISVIATAPKNALMSGPDTYMDKIAVGPQAKGKVFLNAPVEENLSALSKALNKPLKNITVVLLNRPRHDNLINRIIAYGARVSLITDGDVVGGIAPSLLNSGIDCLMGIGASSEGVLAAVALRILGGEIQVQWKPSTKELAHEIESKGLSLDRVYSTEDIVNQDPCAFTATGICSGLLLKGVKYHSPNRVRTYSLVMRSSSGTIRWIETDHLLKEKNDV